jgi:hypothetical protein
MYGHGDGWMEMEGTAAVMGQMPVDETLLR